MPASKQRGGQGSPPSESLGATKKCPPMLTFPPVTLPNLSIVAHAQTSGSRRASRPQKAPHPLAGLFSLMKRNPISLHLSDVANMEHPEDGLWQQFRLVRQGQWSGVDEGSLPARLSGSKPWPSTCLRCDSGQVTTHLGAFFSSYVRSGTNHSFNLTPCSEAKGINADKMSSKKPAVSI